MVYDSNSRDNGRDLGYGREDTSWRDYPSSARDYAAAGQYDRGDRSYGRYDQPDRSGRGQQQDRGRRDDSGQDQARGQWRNVYGSDRPGSEDGRYRNTGSEGFRPRGSYERDPRSHAGDDRGFVARAGDEVRSWFGDEDAERRREADARYYERSDRSGGGRHDDDYRQWRDTQVSQLDRDYHEYRQENSAKFENEFSQWRTSRQTQRDSLRQVKEHAEVIGSDGEHVGTVDKTRDDRILLTKTDADAGGRHHSIPSRWISTVEDGKVTLSRTAAEAKAAWEDEDRSSAMFGYGDDQNGPRRDREDTTGGGRDSQGRMLNRSFSGTY